MANTLIPQTLSQLSSMRMPSLWDEDEMDTLPVTGGNISISEDEKHIYVDAAVPGVEPSDIDVTFDKGMLWIRGETMQEENDKKKKFYRQAANSFSYRITVPGEIDEKSEPEATCENGMVKVTFTKAEEAQPKKIAIKSSSNNGNAKKTQQKRVD